MMFVFVSSLHLWTDRMVSCCLFDYIYHGVFFSQQVMDNFVTSIKKTAITIITQEIFIDDPFTRVQNLKVLCNIISKRLHMFLYISKHVYLTKILKTSSKSHCVVLYSCYMLLLSSYHFNCL